MIIGYTTGVFDLFHIGHLNILKRAKEHCDYLIAGVSTDELVQSYKNKTPVIPFHERIAIVDSIQYVDKVIAQEHRDKYKTWEELQYDVMFVGDDWKGTPLFDDLEAKFQKVGVNIKYFPYTGGVSSTLVKEKLLT
nr:adenylyltransferase/cytidyltransferase family protein [Salipaludibacillus sp. LMS25]